MATQGPTVWFNAALNKIVPGGPIDLDSDNFKAVLCTTTQAITAAFSGTSGDCRYSDLTAQLTTANGYTSGGFALTSVTLSRLVNRVKWAADPILWTLTGSISFRYMVLFDDTAPNDDLLGFCDMDTSGMANITVQAGALQFSPNSTNGFLGWVQ